MKEGWVVKNLGEVCDIYQPKTISTSALVENGKYLVYGANGVIGKYDQYNHTESELLMTCRGATCGTINISEPYSWINGNAMVIHPFEGNITMSYLKYVLRGIDLSNVITGAAQPQITRQSLSPLLIPIPSLPEQSRIVEELDLLSNIIEKKRQQLSELDNLAQSIFYDMFGDPVTNEKGWEVKAMKEVAPQKPYKGDVPSINGKYWLLNLDMIVPNTGEIIDKCYFEKEEIGNSTIAFDRTNVLYSKLRPYLNKVVIPNDIGYATTELVPLCPLVNVLNREFLAHLLRSYSFVSYINDKVAGAKMPRVSMDILRAFPVILPPLSLQQLFAQKIEAIEKQKALIKQSIAETEELFNSRMDYYFS